MGRYIPGDIDETLALSTLAAKTLVGVNFDNTVIERAIVTSIRATYSMGNFTKATDDGPILVGVAHSDYSDSEIEQVIEATLSWNVADKIAQEIAKRQVRRIGIFENPATVDESVTLNDGRPIKTKLNWTLTTGQTLKLWSYNMGVSALATTSPQVHMQGKANLFLL